MKIAIGCDHGALALKNKVYAHLTAQGHEVVDFGTHTPDSCDYPTSPGPPPRPSPRASARRASFCAPPASVYPSPPTRSRASAAPCFPT